MKIKYNLLVSGLLGVVSMCATSFAFADYYPYNNYYYNYNQPVGVTSWNGGSYYDNGYYNNYNYGYNNYYNGYNNNYNYGYNNCYNNNCYNYGYNNYYSLTPQTSAASYTTSNTATINGYVTLSGNYNNYGNYGTAWFVYGTGYSNLNYSTNPASITSSTGINANLTGLACGTTYYFRAVTNGQNGTQYGNILSFTTAQCYYNYNNYYPYYNYNNYYHGGNIPNNIRTNCVRRYY